MVLPRRYTRKLCHVRTTHLYTSNLGLGETCRSEKLSWSYQDDTKGDYISLLAIDDHTTHAHVGRQTVVMTAVDSGFAF
jgi:hypothetical protein